MTDVQIENVQPLTPHNQAVYEAGKQMLVESVSVGRAFSQFMVGVASGAVPIYVALLELGLPKDYRLTVWKGGLALVPAVLLLVAAACFALGTFPRTGSFSLDSIESIEDVRQKAIRRRGRLAAIGFLLFSAGLLAAVIASLLALRVKEPPPQPTPPLQVRIVR